MEKINISVSKTYCSVDKIATETSGNFFLLFFLMAKVAEYSKQQVKVFQNC